MRCFAVLLLMLGASNLLAQPTGTIAGKVTDKETSRPLAGAHITIERTRLGASSDQNGEFVLSGVEIGTRQVKFSFVGYVTQTKSVSVAEGQVTTIAMSLVPFPIPGEPITVTATRGRERETPATFETLDRMSIRERYTTQDIPVLLSELPSTTYYSEAGNGIGYTYLNIRGFDSRRIAVMVNGIPQNDPEDHNVYWLDFPDLAASLEDVQVQRGAGSAFYGPPAIGGSVNLVTSDFGRQRFLQLSAGVGSFNTRKYSVSLSSGLIDNQYAIHARLSKILSSGYRDRSWVDFNSYFLGLIRYDEDMTTQVNFYGGPIADHLAYYGISKADVKDKSKRKANPIIREEEIENFSQPHYELFHEWRINSKVVLNNTLFIVLGDGFFDYDGSWAPYSYFRITPENGFNVIGDPDTLYLPGALIRAQVTNRQYGWLPRITVKHENGELIAGAELRIHRSDHWGRLQWTQMLPPDVPRDFKYYSYKGAKDILSVYAHELYSPRQDITVMLNLQYIYNRYRLYDEQFVGTYFAVPYHFVNPRVGINYNMTDEWNTYLSIGYTTREPRLKNLYDAAEASTPVYWGAVVPQFELTQSGSFDFSRPLVKPESLLDVELGGGYSAEGARAFANLYWMEFSDEIVKSGQVDRFGQPITGNAHRTRHIGLELSGKLTFLSHFELSGNATFSHNRFVSHTDYSTGSPVNLRKNPIAGFPDVLANARFSFRDEGFAISVSGRYVGKQYTDNFKNEANTVDPFFVTDAWTSYRLENAFSNVDLEARLFVNNIFNTLYAAYGEGSDFFVGAERNIFFNLAISI
ncbi:MAG: TonB-dependent receptor [Ignavibacteriae bacterium]|nr:TonB-dependent receptor [Ignavibacteriota bacterium]